MGARVPNDIIIQALIDNKGWIDKAAKSIGCHRNTITNRLAREGEVKRVYQELKEARHDKVERRLQDLIDEGNPTAIIFYLKTQAKQRGYVEQIEHTGKDSGPVVVKVVYEDDE